jgi:hypothetical protein
LSGGCLLPIHGQKKQTVPQTRAALHAVTERRADKDHSILLEVDDPIFRTDAKPIMMTLRRKSALAESKMLLMPLFIR